MLESHTRQVDGDSVEVPDIGELSDVVTATLADAGLDRMTGSRVEEFLTPVALTAHL